MNTEPSRFNPDSDVYRALDPNLRARLECLAKRTVRTPESLVPIGETIAQILETLRKQSSPQPSQDEKL